MGQLNILNNTRAERSGWNVEGKYRKMREDEKHDLLDLETAVDEHYTGEPYDRVVGIRRPRRTRRRPSSGRSWYDKLCGHREGESQGATAVC